MNGNVEMLDYIYQNARMGSHAITQLLDKTNDIKFINHLNTQLKEYKNIEKEAIKLLNDRGHEETELGLIERLSSSLVINIQTMADDSVSHMAEMMMKGSNMGIIEATKNLKKYKNADGEILCLGKKLLRTEEANMEHIKGFLQ